MTALVTLLLSINMLIASQCYLHAKRKGYPVRLFLVLGVIPYFNLVVWVYLLFLPALEKPLFKPKSTP
ncbi:hypothetical protein MHM89_11675 [Pseudoalteromonas sp. CNC9-20]|uniref:hypothetical protein n=1 Tax=Pseudoalteromonas TaxID=53246 RepID=UPI0003489CC1|nr:MULTISPECIES: hypothetical protein [Pseudoalteromonas]MCG7570593.1 hypothetical protein [Pseudoalteromonas sp. CNC9-20]|tara:strand:- start:150 stop:353 length:204 start_codon:yes stop_codon:yes gene_type:complete